MKKKRYPKKAGTKAVKYLKIHRDVPTEDLVLPALSPEAINNRFVGATAVLGDLFFREAIKEPAWMVAMREQRIANTMRKHDCTRKAAEKIIEEERAAAEAVYNSPLKVAERKIAALEGQLERIREFVLDPDKYDSDRDCP